MAHHVPMTRRDFLGASAGAALAAAAEARKPNIIFILADDLGYGDLGCYGQKRIRTPNLDRLAAEGTRFSDAYAGCSVCAPSRSVLMTGRHMGHTSVRANPGGVPLLAEDVTVAEVLREAGYVNGIFGKWGLGDIGTTGVPTRQGFHEFFGYLHQVHAHLQYPEFLYSNDEEYPLPGNRDRGRKTYANDVITDKTLDFIRRNKGRPFFCCSTPTLPHGEWLAPEDSFAEYRGKFPEIPCPARGHMAAQDHPRAAVAAMITRLDGYVGRVMSLLKELKIDGDTIVFFTSDNGAGFPQFDREDFLGSRGPLRGTKGAVYEGGLRAPMIVRWPGRIRAGAVSDLPWAFYDFLPTAAELAGARTPSGIDGISVAPALLGRRQPGHEFMYWENASPEKPVLPPQAVRMGDWKAVRPKPGAEIELYNLKADLAESRNVAGANPRVVARVTEFLKTARTAPRPQTQPPHNWWNVVD